jgi:hypothetical protein
MVVLSTHSKIWSREAKRIKDGTKLDVDDDDDDDTNLELLPWSSPIPPPQGWAARKYS